MILLKETLEAFGYAPDTLSRKTTKKVRCACDNCGTVFDRGFGDIRNPAFVTCSKRCATSLRHKTMPAAQKVVHFHKIAEKNRRPEARAKRAEDMRERWGAMTDEEYTTWNAKQRQGIADLPEAKKQELAAFRSQRWADLTPEGREAIYAKFLATWGKKTFVERSEAVKQQWAALTPESVARHVAAGIATRIVRYGTATPTRFFGKAEEGMRQALNDVTGQEFVSTYDVIAPKQLDAYCETLGLAVEHCGLHWHHERSPQPRGEHYHVGKYAACQAKNVALFTVWECEWADRREAVIAAVVGALEGGFNAWCVLVEDEVLVDNRYPIAPGLEVLEELPPRCRWTDERQLFDEPGEGRFRIWDCGYTRYKIP